MKRITSVDKLDLIINTAFVMDSRKYMDTINPGGCFVQVALPETKQNVIYNNADLVANQKILTGSDVGSRLEVEETLKFCEDFNIIPMVENYSWADFPKAYQRLLECKAKYRSVVDTAATFDNL